MICALTGFIKVVKTAYQSKNEAMRCVREWAALYRMPYAIKADSGPLFRLSFKKELEELGVKTIHSSIYHSQSPGHVDCSIRALKDILDKVGRNISQLQLNEHIYAINCQEDSEKGSSMSRFMGRATRTAIPISWQRSKDWRKQIELRGEEIEKCVKKKEHTRKESDV